VEPEVREVSNGKSGGAQAGKPWKARKQGNHGKPKRAILNFYHLAIISISGQ